MLCSAGWFFMGRYLFLLFLYFFFIYELVSIFFPGETRFERSSYNDSASTCARTLIDVVMICSVAACVFVECWSFRLDNAREVQKNGTNLESWNQKVRNQVAGSNSGFHWQFLYRPDPDVFFLNVYKFFLCMYGHAAAAVLVTTACALRRVILIARVGHYNERSGKIKD